MPPSRLSWLLGRVAVALVALWFVYEFATLETAAAHGDSSAARTLLIAGIIATSALVSSIVGFAFSAIAGSALAYLRVDPVHAVQTMVVCSTAIQLYAVWQIRASIRWRELWPTIAAGAVTVPLGVWMLLHVDPAVYRIGLGVFLSAYGTYAVLRPDNLVVRSNAWCDLAAGALGGIAGGLAGFSGSFVTIWCSMRGWDKLRQRAVYQPFILAMQVVTIVCLRLAAPDTKLASQDVRFLPFAIIGAIAGFALYQRMSNRQFQAATSMLLIVSGLGLLGRSL
ncbi:MAG: sulfite exporter TauE/SafE family protein [Burkholderiales bacterium]|nr:sulfite exporter TauE/SafE family protein [Burkholderiales bacterium]